MFMFFFLSANFVSCFPFPAQQRSLPSYTALVSEWAVLSRSVWVCFLISPTFVSPTLVSPTFVSPTRLPPISPTQIITSCRMYEFGARDFYAASSGPSAASSATWILLLLVSQASERRAACCKASVHPTEAGAEAAGRVELVDRPPIPPAARLSFCCLAARC